VGRVRTEVSRMTKAATSKRLRALERINHREPELDLSNLTEDELRMLEALFTDGRESAAQAIIDAMVAEGRIGLVK